MNCEEEIAEKLSQELAQAIDDELMADLMTSIGWIKVKRPDGLFGLVDRNTKIKLRTWLTHNVKDTVNNCKITFFLNDRSML
jgi:hypothetical protein